MAAHQDLAKALNQQERTVTAFLEELVGEPIDAQHRRHEMAIADTTSALGVAPGHPLLLRDAVLQGRTSGRPYLYAESIIVPSRLTARFRERLDSSDDPIGRILHEEGTDVTREILSDSGRGSNSDSTNTGFTLDECLLARTYRIDIGGRPVMMIDEWFLPSLQEFLTPG